MTKRVKVMLSIITVLLCCLGILVLINARQKVQRISDVSTVQTYDVNEVPLDDRMDSYLATTEDNFSIEDDKDAGYKVGTLEIDSCSFKEDVMYSDNLMYYTTHNSKNAKSEKGAIFIDARITDIPNSKILVIHGLTTKDADMFTLLASYTDAGWSSKNGEIKLSLNNEAEKSYQLFAVVETNNSEAVIYLNCETDLAYESFYDSLLKQSCIKTDVEFSTDKQMVVLNTANQDGKHYIVCFLEK